MKRKRLYEISADIEHATSKMLYWARRLAKSRAQFRSRTASQNKRLAGKSEMIDDGPISEME